MYNQGSHRLEKYLKMKSRLEKSLKTKFALKSAWKLSIDLEKYLILLFLVFQTAARQLETILKSYLDFSKQNWHVLT